MHDQLRLLKEALDRAPAPPDARGRGIVTCGAQKYAPYLWLLVRSLRYHGSSLPVEVWYMNGEINPSLRTWLEPYDVTFQCGGEDGWRHPAGNLASPPAFGFKPFAVAASRFREVLFLDADNSVCRCPDFLFDTPEYEEHKAVFWSDPNVKSQTAEIEKLYQAFGMPASKAGTELESGQMLLDKVQHWKALQAVLHMNRQSDFYYRYSYGDKDTWPIGFDFCSDSYRTVDCCSGTWGGWSGRWKVGYALAQGWTDGKPLFFHRISKYKFCLKLRERSSHEIPIVPAAVMDDWIDELVDIWPLVVPPSVEEFYRKTARKARQQELKRRITNRLPPWLWKSE